MAEVDRSSFLSAIGKEWGPDNPESTAESVVEEVVEDTPEVEDNIENGEEVVESAVETSQEGNPVVEDTNTLEPVEEEVFSSFYEEEESPQEPEPQPTTVKDKVKYNLKDYLEEHNDTVSKYFKFKNLDVDSMSNEELLKFKLQQENPAWDSNDISDALKDDYGIGLKKRDIPEDALDDEIERIKEYNQRIDDKIRRGERLLKADVHKAKQLLKQEQESLELPEVELDVEVTADRSKIIEEYTTELVEQSNKFRQEVWTPAISAEVSKLGGFKQKFDYEVESGDKVVSDVTFKLTPEQKENLKNYLENYQGHPSDDKYVKNPETGEVDYTRLVSDKAMELFAPDIIKSYVKQLTAQFKQKFVKEKVVNYSDEPRRVSKEGQPKDRAVAQFESFRQKYDEKMGKFK